MVIWGAPISAPAPDPTNANFIYQRFQRGVIQNVPPDLMQQSRETRFYNQYCPGQTLSLCRRNELPGTDLTFAFVNG